MHNMNLFIGYYEYELCAYQYYQRVILNVTSISKKKKNKIKRKKEK